ncbi:family 16 glycosylhydrolase [Puniceicoccales bacterium CK1056]|uniref:Family 16 glycosylhydrolase n=1 Tax=Oceanipulchritudo coccoides TaxID=2706888 RepID=A0A6B2M2Q7_9BACT|nr:family 16 glycosylhydrolase [Oceanipulchritudo coccoides]NDV63238.1 family 16 glycosylhydrolase [Oceanipulchritudo coccoides]
MTKYSALLSIVTVAFAAANLSANAPEGYVLEWSDEFDYVGAPNPEFWTHEVGAGGWGNNEVQVYTDSLDNSRVENGNLVIEVHQVDGGRVPGYTSARLITREKAQWKYGRMEIRAKLPSETGTWPAIWMLGADRLYGNGGWPDNGEIDIMEHVGYEEDPLYLDLVGNPEVPNIHGTAHLGRTSFIRSDGGVGSNGDGDSTYLSDASTEFHTYAINWTEDLIEWEVDGIKYFSLELPTFRVPPPQPLYYYWPFDQRFFMILNVAVGGRWGGNFSTGSFPSSPYGRGIDDNGVWPQRMEVDYVRVYKKDEPPEATPVPGRILATDLDHSDGILIVQSGVPELPHNLVNIDPDDSAEFAITVPQAGAYMVHATVATPNNSRLLSLSVPDSGDSTPAIELPNTGSYDTWQSVELGEINLMEGLNTLTMTTSTGGFTIAAFDVSEGEGSVWKGLNIDAFGNAQTNSWLGQININAAPWIYSYQFEDYIFMPVALEDTFSADNQWIFIPR